MTQEQLTALRQLRDAGYAVCVFTPDELGNAPSDRVEDAMCEGGWERIHYYATEDQD